MGVSVNNINFADLSLRHVQDIGHEQSQAGEMGQGNNIQYCNENVQIFT